MYGFSDKLVHFSKLVYLVTDNTKGISLLQNLSIEVNYESVMFYSTEPMLPEQEQRATGSREQEHSSY